MHRFDGHDRQQRDPGEKQHEDALFVADEKVQQRLVAVLKRRPVDDVFLLFEHLLRMQRQKQKTFDQRADQNHHHRNGDQDNELADLAGHQKQRQKRRDRRYRRQRHRQQHLAHPLENRLVFGQAVVDEPLDIFRYDNGVVDDDPDDDQGAEQRDDIDGIAHGVDDDKPDGERKRDAQRDDKRDTQIDQQRHRHENENQSEHQVRNDDVEAFFDRL